MRILKGQKGILFGEMITFEGEYVRCPKLDELIRAAGQGVPEIKTPETLIEANNNLNGITLRFTFPSCRKAKIE